MKMSQLLIIIATVWIAPHSTKWFGIGASSLAVLLAILVEVLS